MTTQGKALALLNFARLRACDPGDVGDLARAWLAVRESSAEDAQTICGLQSNARAARAQFDQRIDSLLAEVERLTAERDAEFATRRAHQRRAEVAEAYLDSLRPRAVSLARLVGSAIVRASLAPGETATGSDGHALIAAVDSLRTRAETAEAELSSALAVIDDIAPRPWSADLDDPCEEQDSGEYDDDEWVITDANEREVDRTSGDNSPSNGEWARGQVAWVNSIGAALTVADDKPLLATAEEFGGRPVSEGVDDGE